MMTLDEIRNVEFSRGRGYRAEEVDDFIDACAETVEQLNREKEELSQKMKVLADKLVEYRNDEDSIRAALLNAQRAGDAARREAEEAAAAMKKQAEEEVEEIRSAALNKIAEEKNELQRVQKEVEAFKARLMTLYKEHLAVIGMLPEQEATKEAAEPQAEEAAEADVVVTPVEEETVQPATEGDEEMKVVSRFSDLKFGEDYDIREDTDDDEEEKPRGFFKKRK
ncbi:MAG: DivIVA domain-containing protein [Clostridia bacterium]|nr:DivIVA domain-containing protein [Clostridia bacterium]